MHNDGKWNRVAIARNHSLNAFMVPICLMSLLFAAPFYGLALVTAYCVAWFAIGDITSRQEASEFRSSLAERLELDRRT